MNTNTYVFIKLMPTDNIYIYIMLMPPLRYNGLTLQENYTI